MEFGFAAVGLHVGQGACDPRCGDVKRAMSARFMAGGNQPVKAKMYEDVRAAGLTKRSLLLALVLGDWDKVTSCDVAGC